MIALSYKELKESTYYFCSTIHPAGVSYISVINSYDLESGSINITDIWSSHPSSKTPETGNYHIDDLDGADYYPLEGSTHEEVMANHPEYFI